MNDSAGKLPELTPEQRAAALVRAAEARTERAHIKMDIRSGKVDPSRLVLEPEGAARRMRIFEFLTSCPGIGAATARKLIAEVGVSETRRLQGLGSRQRGDAIRDPRAHRVGQPPRRGDRGGARREGGGP